jgi:hypothetical protein
MKRQLSIGELFARNIKQSRESPADDARHATACADTFSAHEDENHEIVVVPDDKDGPSGTDERHEAPPQLLSTAIPPVTDQKLDNITQTGNAWPACWTREQWLYFTQENEWLFCNKGKIGCSICKEVGNLGTHRLVKGQKIQLSKEWTSCSVGPFGDNKNKQLASLRKKVREHKLSANHTEAEKVKSLAKCNILQESVAEQERDLLETTCHIFRTAYYIAKNDRPYQDHPELIDLLRANGCNIGRILHSPTVCTDIIDHIAHDMRRKLVSYVVSQKKPFSILIDESTSFGKSSCLIVCLRSCVGDATDSLSLFLDLVELQDSTSTGIVETLVACLNKHGLTDAVLSQFWLGIGTDGASVMLGRRGGLCVQLKEKYPNLISWHCFNHRLELAVHDAVKACTEINHFKIFMEKLYSLYSMSPKNRRALQQCATDVGAELHKIGRVLDVRWVASSYRAVKAVWTSYPALYAHFVKASTDYMTMDSKERSQYKGLATKLESAVFLKNIAVMLDALEELSDLSESLQADTMSMPKAHKLIVRQIQVFQARKLNDGDYMKAACKAVDELKFRGITIITESQRGDKSICKEQFYQALIDSLQSRMLPDSEKSLVEAMAILFPATWTDILAPDHGESELKLLAGKFLVPYSADLKQAYRDFKESKGNDVPPPMQRLITAVVTLPISTAACERGFSKMNIVCSPLRSVLTVPHMSSLLFLSMVGPPVIEWNPLPYAKTWVSKGRRHADYLGCLERRVRVDTTEALKTLWKVID